LTGNAVSDIFSKTDSVDSVFGIIFLILGLFFGSYLIRKK